MTSQSGQPFDKLAPTYDADFTGTQIGRYLRGRVHARLDTLFKPGQHVLELGCGTGEDARYLAERGVRVTATDASAEMVAAARAKNADQSLVTVERLDMAAFPSEFGAGQFDGVFSNFGAVNCIGDWRPLAAWLSDRLRPGGLVALGVMSPVCLWELLWHGAHGDFRTATRRLRGQATFQPTPDSEPLKIYYPTIRRLTRAFAPHFERVSVRGLGVFLPPSDVYAVIERRPGLLRWLTALEARTAAVAPLALYADHYWIELKKR